MIAGSRGRLCPALLLVLACLAVQAFSSFLLLNLACLLVGGLALAWIWRETSASGGSEPKELESTGASEILLAASHDLRQPVQAVSLFAASLSAQALPENVRKLASGIEAGAQSLSGMLEAVFGLAKLSAGKLSCELQPLALEDALASAVADKLDMAEERELHLRHAPSSVKVLADSAVLSQALAGLLRHALDKAEGGILLGGRRRSGLVWIELRYGDAGASDLKVADFQPGEGYCDALPDKGYGLAYAQGLAKLMGGQLELMSQAGRGSLLRLSLKSA